MSNEILIENYLKTLRAELGPLTIGEREEIIREIAAHIRDSAEAPGASVEGVLARLGGAKELAVQYRDGLLIRRASRSISPLVLMRASLRLATKSASGVFVFFCSVFGYALAIGFIALALVKPIFPHHTGAWVQDGQLVALAVYTEGIPPTAHDVLGLWIIPLGLIAGSLTLLLTTYLIRTSLRLSRRMQARLV